MVDVFGTFWGILRHKSICDFFINLCDSRAFLHDGHPDGTVLFHLLQKECQPTEDNFDDIDAEDGLNDGFDEDDFDVDELEVSLCQTCSVL